jgi:hypothetical protein
MIFRSGDLTFSDERVYHMRRLKSMSVRNTILLLYPRLMQVDVLPKEVAEYDHKFDLILPERMRLSIERMSSDGAFLLGRFPARTATHRYDTHRLITISLSH